MAPAVDADASIPSLQELDCQRLALKQHVAELQMAVPIESEDIDELREQVDSRLISVAVAKINGNVLQCNIPEDSFVQDLLDAAMVDDKDLYVVHTAHAALLSVDLLTDKGVVMEKDKMISDYQLSSDSSVMMVKKRFINGSYKCWAQIDYNNPAVPQHDKFTLLIKDEVVSINGVAGTADGDVAVGERVSVAFSKPILLRSTLPNSRAFFQVTGCEFECRSGDYSSAFWFPVEGKLLGTSSSQGAKPISFKGRLSACNCSKCRSGLKCAWMRTNF